MNNELQTLRAALVAHIDSGGPGIGRTRAFLAEIEQEIKAAEYRAGRKNAPRDLTVGDVVCISHYKHPELQLLLGTVDNVAERLAEVVFDDNSARTYTRRKDGSWREQGCSARLFVRARAPK